MSILEPPLNRRDFLALSAAGGSSGLVMAFRKRIVPAPELNHETGGAIASYASRPSFDYSLPGGLNKPANQPHLENFFAAIRGEATLNFDARTAFLSEAPIYSIESAARNRQIIDIGPAQLTP